ncbi:MAG: nickel pincer cofactor biosynthesis protein LarC [Candidatus Polarisedimenticolia bacterium]
MRLLYLDCASGLSGDMLLGAMLDAGLDRRALQSRLGALPLKGYRISTRRVRRASLGAVKFDVHVGRDVHHRGWKEIRALLNRARLDPRVRDASLRVFERLIRVEARLHRIPVDKVHLHELGAVDAIVDIVGGVAGLQELGSILDGGRLICSPLNVGHGAVAAHHGLLPVPAPATAELLAGAPIYADGGPGERVTPTGAAIVSTLASSFGPPPPMVIERVGYGAGSRDDADRPNVTRVLVGRSWPAQEPIADAEVSVLECTIDDMNPQGFGYLRERLFALGALEVFYTGVHMKKDRPGVLVTVICAADLVKDAARVLFEESTTLGIRHRREERLELDRRETRVTTRYGRVRMKVASLNGRVVQAQPEYEDCRRLAARRRVPLKRVQAAAAAAWEKTR